MLPPLATVEELAVWVDEEIPEDDPRALQILRAASALVRSEARRTWIVEGDRVAPPDEVHTIVLEVAQRAWTNPDRLDSETVGEWTGRRKDAGLYLTEEERRILGRYRSGGGTGLWTLATTRGDHRADGTLYAPVQGGGDPIPWLQVER